MFSLRRLTTTKTTFNKVHQQISERSLWTAKISERSLLNCTMHRRSQICKNSTRSASGLAGKVAIVTASTDGIGLGIAKRLYDEGCKVVVSSRKADNVAAAVEEIKAEGQSAKGGDLLGCVCHVGKAEDRSKLVTSTMEKFGKLDILVSNAAVNPTFGPALQCSEDQWDKIFDINVKAAFLLAQSAAPEMMKNENGGAIVFNSSIAGLLPMPMLGPYSVSKTALLGLTKVLSADLAPQGIRVNCVAPGIIETKFAGALTSNDDVKSMILNMNHIKRLGQTQDISGVVAFLCSDDASYITGETIVAAGGAPSRL